MTNGVRRFEDLSAWQRARELTRRVYLVTRGDAFHRDFGLSSQVQRASVSIMANIAEGFDRKRSAEFHQHLSIAKASCAEVRSHLYVALDVGYITKEDFDVLRSLAEEVNRVVGPLRQAVEERRGLAESEERRSQNSELQNFRTPEFARDEGPRTLPS